MRTSLAVLAGALGALVACRGGEDPRPFYRVGDDLSFDGAPQVHIGLMSGQREVTVSAPGGLTLYPGREAAAVAGRAAWTITVEDARPPRATYWTVVSRVATPLEVVTWRRRGHLARVFVTGTRVRYRGGELDRRERLLAVAPTGSEADARATASELAAEHGIAASIHLEVADPTGALAARDPTGATVRARGAVWVAAADGGPVTVKDVRVGGGGSQVGEERRESRRYHGRILVTQGADGALTVVNAVAPDRYLAGVVPSELPPSAPPEALKAQAVAARVEMLGMIGTRHFGEPFMACATQHCQVYGGVQAEDERATAAVEATRGEVLIDEQGGLVRAYYSSTCGGFGEHNETIWSGRPSSALRGHLDALGADLAALAGYERITDDNIERFLAEPPARWFCGQVASFADKFRWTVRLTAADLDALVAAGYPEVGAVVALEPLERGVSGRILRLRIVGRGGTVIHRGDLAIRRLFGGLRSSVFVVEAERADGAVTAWTFRGGGFGHGVGMCQVGAIGMAAAGHDHRAILGHYYRGSRLERLD